MLDKNGRTGELPFGAPLHLKEEPGTCASILCNHSVQNHIARMKELWNGFPTDQKPEWLTWEQLLQYEKVMTETGIPVKNCSD